MEVSSARRGGSSGTTSNREELALEPADGSADLERQGEWQQNPFCCRGPTQDRPSQRHRTPVASEANYKKPIKYSRPGNRSLGEVPFDPPESRAPPDGEVAATRRKVSRRVLHLTTFHRLRIGRSWIGRRVASGLSTAAMESGVPWTGCCRCKPVTGRPRKRAPRKRAASRKAATEGGRESEFTPAFPADGCKRLCPNERKKLFSGRPARRSRQCVHALLRRCREALLGSSHDTKPDT